MRNRTKACVVSPACCPIDLHPLFLKEMAFRYNLVDTGGSGMHARSSPTQDVIRAMSHILEGTCVSRVRGIKAYQKAAYDYIKGDIREALLGEFGSPIKSALEAVRYCRNTYRAFLENANFPASEHRTFLVEFLPAMQRSTYGPPISRNEELLALIDRSRPPRLAFNPAASISASIPTGVPPPCTHPMKPGCRFPTL